jgi:hypothetical protein
MLAAVDQDHELVAAHSTNSVRVAQRALHAVGHRDQQVVAGLVAERVIDILEIVEIDVQRRAPRPAASISRQQLFDPVHDERAVGQARQRIVHGLVQ